MYSQVTGLPQERKMTDTTSHDKSIEANITEVLSPDSLTSADAMSEKRLSSARASTRRTRPRKKAKPLAGDRFFKACSRAPLILKAFVIVVLSGLPCFVFLGLAFTKYSNSVITTLGETFPLRGSITNGTLLNATLANGAHLNAALSGGYIHNGTTTHREVHRVTVQELSIWLSGSWAAIIIVFCLAQGVGRLSTWLCTLSVRSSKYAPLVQTMYLRLTMLAWVGVVHQTTCLMWPFSDKKQNSGSWVYTLREAFVSIPLTTS